MPKAGEVIVPFEASIVTEQPEEYLKETGGKSQMIAHSNGEHYTVTYQTYQ